MKKEIRNFQVRAAQSGNFVLEGRAVGYNRLSGDLGGFKERVRYGAFTRSLSSPDSDVTCDFNHDDSKILGRTTSGTLVLRDNPTGLDFTCQLDANNTDHQNIYSLVRRGDLQDCSWAFTVPPGGDSFSDEDDDDGGRVRCRTISNANLIGISVCTHPAYPGVTSVAARGFVNRLFRTPQNEDTVLRSRLAAQGRQIEKDAVALCNEWREVRDGNGRVIRVVPDLEAGKRRVERARAMVEEMREIAGLE